MTRSSTRPNPTMHLQRAEPPQSQQPSPGGQRRRRQALLGLGLLAVAILSGFLWWLVRHDPDSSGGGLAGGTPAADTSTPGNPPEGTTTVPGPTTVTAGRFTFDSLAPNQVGDSCATASYGKVRTWFADHPCERVVRGLYATRAGGGRALVSVVVVTMPSVAQAQRLKKMTDTSGTGNVSDLLNDGSVSVPGAPEVAGGNYASSTAGNTVTIVEAAFFGKTKNRELLDEITAQALRIATEMN